MTEDGYEWGTEPTDSAFDWRTVAMCEGMPQEVFFPKRGASTKEARAVCEMCAVKTECLLDACMRREIAGIRGGQSVRERRATIKLMEAEGIVVPKAESYKE